MDLFDKFDAFEVKSSDRISADDKAFLDKLKSVYESTLDFYKEMYDRNLAEIGKYDKEEYKDFNSLLPAKFSILEAAINHQKSFWSSIYWHFQSKYNLTLDSREIKKEEKYGRLRTYRVYEEDLGVIFAKQDYNDFVDDILGQLGGRSFEDFAIKQIKDKLHKECFPGGNERISVKNATIKFDSWGYVEDPWREGLPYKVRLTNLHKALADAFEKYVGYTPIICHNFRMYYDFEITAEELKSGLVVGGDILSIKFFKNGRIDLKFSSPEKAREFARDWCGYMVA